jgi:hypothetical protein
MKTDMKLIPPQTATASAVDRVAVLTVDADEVRALAEQQLIAEKKIQAMGLLDDTVKIFTRNLSRAVTRIDDSDDMLSVLGLVALLTGTGDMLNVVGNFATMTGGADGHKRGGSPTSASDRAHRGRPRKNRAVTLGPDGQPIKRGRGRPKGSKNKPKPVVAEPIAPKVVRARRVRAKATRRAAKPIRTQLATTLAVVKRKRSRAARKDTPVVVTKRHIAARKTAVRQGGQRSRRQPARKAARKR